MTTRERREEYSTANVVRVLHPSRPLSPSDAITSLDNNLDHLLDDLQSSVSRQNNSIDYSSTHKGIQYLAPSNTTTVVRERSISPRGDGRKIYKTAHYEYSSTTGGGLPSSVDAHQNINQLDSLLQDLKHERTATMEKDKSFSNVGIDSGLLEPGTQMTKTTRTYTSSSADRQRNVNRELIFDSPATSTLDTRETREARESRSRQRSPTYQKNVETKIVRDVNYDSEPIPGATSTSKRSYSSEYSKTGQHAIVPYSTTEIVEMVPADIPKELNGMPLSGDILPGPGTKVTTTIKTFTYEIPGDTMVPTNKTFMYKNEAYNTTNTNSQMYPEKDVPHYPGSNQSVVYNHHETYNTTNRTDGYHAEPRERSPLPPNNTTIYKRDTTETTSNTYPGRALSPQPPNQTTYIYKKDVTNKNTNIHHPPHGVQVYPSETYPPQQIVRPHEPDYPGHPTYPGQPGPKHTYIYKHETTNTKNTVYGSPGSGHPDDRYPSGNYPNNTLPPSPRYPNEPSTVIYSSKYSTRNMHGGQPDQQPLLAPAPFPTDGIHPSDEGQIPPRRLDDLLATFDDTDGPNSKVRDEPYVPRKEINTAVASGGKAVAIVEPKVPTKNIAGPPVYYPPGHELSIKNEQSGAAWRAQGGYARASGKYEYESESKSKSSSKSGAAVVPVCLPLCCAMPCVIM